MLSQRVGICVFIAVTDICICFCTSVYYLYTVCILFVHVYCLFFTLVYQGLIRTCSHPVVIGVVSLSTRDASGV